MKEHTTPPCTPPAASPAMARPMIKATEFGAAPQIAEPISHKSTAAKKVYFTSRIAYIFPNTRRKAQLVSSYAVPYQPLSVVEPKSLVIWGSAGDMSSLSYEEGSVSAVRMLSTMRVWTLMET